MIPEGNEHKFSVLMGLRCWRIGLQVCFYYTYIMALGVASQVSETYLQFAERIRCRQ